MTSVLFCHLSYAHEPSEPELTAPVLLERAEAVYPPAALQAGVGGTVGMELTVGADGRVADVKVLRPAGFGLDEAAVAAARRLKFRPAMHDGKPTVATVLFDQNFVARPHLSAETTAAAAAAQPPAVAPAPSYQSIVRGDEPPLAASSVIVRNRDFELQPRTAPGDLLGVVPGLVTVQHQGGGKADQLLLRGFDADHGTDVAVFLDGIPINLPSHAHGQGYADLHFLIPEIVQQIDVEKGPYDARWGDFATGGAVNIVTRDRVDESQVALTVGGFPGLGCDGGVDKCKLVAQERLAAVAAPHPGGWAAKLHPFVAVELARDQGPFDAPEGLYRYSIFGKLSWDATPSTTIGAVVQAYGTGWRGSGQIPSREVDAGVLSRFGSIDPSEGGTSERQMVSLFLRHQDARHEIEAMVYVTRYRLALWNDFTFFVHDPVYGDEIEQDDARVTSGARVAYHVHSRWRSIHFGTTVGVQARWDSAHVELWNATSQFGAFRQRTSPRADADVDPVNLSAYAEEEVRWTRWLRSTVGLRADWFGFTVDDRLTPGGSGTQQKTRVSPKVAVAFRPWKPLELYLDFGMGFHSNDARLTMHAGNTVPRFYAGEVGGRFTWTDRVVLTAALWASYLESETVFNADDATWEPSNPSRRWGIDVSLRARLASWLALDANLAQATATTLPPHGPSGDLALAPRLVFTAGLTTEWRGLRAGLRLRYLGARPAFDSNSPEYLSATSAARVDAQPWAVFDLYGAYRWRWIEAGLSIQNLFDTEWREAQLGNRSCARDEVTSSDNPYHAQCLAGGVVDVHYTPGVPFNLLLTVRIYL
jgi:TonB family protein